MYLNRLGMAIKMDRAIIHMLIEDLEKALQTVVRRQIGQEVKVGVYCDESDERNGEIYMALDDNPEPILAELAKAGYAIDDKLDIETGMNLMFDTNQAQYHYDYDAEIVVISLPADEYIKKSFGIE